jgi:hypothetical protein
MKFTFKQKNFLPLNVQTYVSEIDQECRVDVEEVSARQH